MAEWRSYLLQSMWHAGLRPGSPAAICFAIAGVAVATAAHMLFGIIGGR